MILLWVGQPNRRPMVPEASGERRNAQKETARRSGPSLLVTYRSCSFGRAALWDFYCPCQVLARFRAAALLLTGLLTRRLILLTGLVLVRHVVSFHGNTITTI